MPRNTITLISFDSTLPPIRIMKADVDAYRQRCREKGITVSEGIRRHVRREGRKAGQTPTKRTK